MSPLLSIIVPIYNVQTFLPACLRSIADQSVGDIEVIMVDDGSTDSSPALADDFASRDPRFRVLHVANGGPGHARNVGLDAVTGDYLAFVDGDDEVVDDGFETLLGSALASRSDIVSGRVTRITSTRRYPSALHTRALPTARTRTHISRQPSLLYDVTMWNKVFRRDFWQHHAFRFPEGVLYEDVALATETHVRALAVDVITGTVYRWRDRDDGSLSITQRRGELSNLRDRVTALTTISEFLTIVGPTSLRAPLDRKALGTDLALYFPELLSADDDYVAGFVELINRYLRKSSRAVERRLSPALQVKYQLVRAGAGKALVELLRHEEENRTIPVRRRGRHMVLVVPPSTAAIVGRDLLDVSRRLPVQAGVGSIRFTSRHLVVDGFAYLKSVPLQSPLAALRRVVVTESGGSRRIIRWLLPRRRPDRTAAAGAPHLGYDWSGFRFRIAAAELAPATGRTSVTWTVTVQVLTPVAAGGARLGPARSGAAWIPPIGRVGDLTLVAGWQSMQSLRIGVSTERPVLTGAAVDDERVQLSISAPTDTLGPSLAVRVSTQDGPVESELVATSVAGQRTLLTGRIPVDALLAVTGDHVELPIHLMTASGPRRMVPAFSGEISTVVGSRELLLRRGSDGDVRAVVRRPWVVVTAAESSRGWLIIHGRTALPADQQPEIFLRGPGGIRILAQTHCRDGSFTTRFDLLKVPTPGAVGPIGTGRWSLQRTDPDDPEQAVAVPAATGAAAAIESAASTAPPYFNTWVDRHRTVTLTVHALPMAERGGFNQDRLRSRHYARVRRQPLRDLIVFESWQGKQYSDNPRAISEELARRADPRPRVWVVRDHSVPVPADVRRVVRGSAEYYTALATARWLVANDSTTQHLVKREGQGYLQTWHGTPMKRIGFDIGTIHFRNKRYLDELRSEVAKWDFLISPDQSSTEILRTAFEFGGAMLETGYPRNDLLLAPGAADIGLRTRQELGIDPAAKVVLWAPTWRDHQYDSSGRHTIAMNDDVRTLAAALAGKGVLLFRGHHLVSTSIDDTQVRHLIRNVSDYPDIAELYLAADVLITDYSSAMFDYAVLGRPILIYAWDLPEYRDEIRGFYIDFEHSAPAPVMVGIDEVIGALDDITGFAAANLERYQQFTGRYCALSDGHAAQRVVDRVFGDAS